MDGARVRGKSLWDQKGSALVLPPGVEPRSTAPEAVVLSIELREQRQNVVESFLLRGASILLANNIHFPFERAVARS